MYFYFRLIPNFNSGSVKKTKQIIQLVNKQIDIWEINSIEKEKTKNICIVWKKSKNIVMSNQKKKLWLRTK